VWLNAGSSLSYSSKFNDDNRNVKLEGEAYFEVTHHDSKKFTVKTANYDVVVKGTKFDVASYQSDPISMVSLLKGSVELAYDKGVIDMKPGERVVLDKKTGEFTKEKYTGDSRAWIDNRTEFDNISLIDLARVLSRQYDVAVHVQSARLANTHFAVSLRNKETIQDVLDALQMIEPMKITREKKDIYITE
jgi:ferric-dicitrate binding protein FerR (iron transport regulator)